jgi:predicted nucleic acid-binding Zn ribbon protein
LDGPYGWCGVCTSTTPGNPGYCPQHVQQMVSEVQEIQKKASFLIFIVLSLIAYFLTLFLKFSSSYKGEEIFNVTSMSGIFSISK